MLTKEQWKMFYQLRCLKEQGKEDTEMFNNLAVKLWETLGQNEPKVEKNSEKVIKK
ncbi:MAG: hypothetical protein J6S67_04095 [Methanobrevibacter sp.]|nr:hypothetical protein [Methanobrevibacter sp.]